MAANGRIVDAIIAHVLEPDFPDEAVGQLNTPLGAYAVIETLHLDGTVEALPDTPAVWQTFSRWALEKFFDRSTLPYEQWLLRPARDWRNIILR